MSDFLVQHSLRLVLKQQQRHKSPRTRIPKNFHIFRVHRHKNDIERTDKCDENSTRTTRRTKGRTLSRFVRQSIRSFFCPELFFRWFLSWYFFFKLKTKHSFATSKQKVSFKKMLYAKTTTTWWWWRRRDNDPYVDTLFLRDSKLIECVLRDKLFIALNVSSVFSLLFILKTRCPLLWCF